MKKLYFLNEEESIRILNLHKDATKRQYLKEDEDADKTGWSKYPCVKGMEGAKYQSGDNSYKVGEDTYFSNGRKQTGLAGSMIAYTCPSSSTESETQATEVQKPVQSVNKPLVMDIQKKLREKEIYLGNTGDNEDGVDGVMGKLTLNGIISLLGKPEPLKSFDLTTKPLASKPTEDLMKPVTTAETPEAATAAAAAAAAAATTGTSPQATEKDL